MAIVLSNYPIAYVQTPKCACSSVKLALYELDHGHPYQNYRDESGRIIYVHDGWRGADPHKHRDELKDYFTFCVIRDPLQRFVSTFSNRVLVMRELSNAVLNPAIAEKYGLRPDPDLETLVHNLAEYREAGQSFGFHAAPQFRFIGQKLSLYSRVFHFEHLADIAPALTEITGKPVSLPHEQRSAVKVEVSELSPKAIRKLVEFYQHDYRILKGIYEPP